MIKNPINNFDKWKYNLEQVKIYIDENNKRPGSKDKDNNINYLGEWISHQLTNYKKQKIMSNEDIYNK